MKLCHDSDLAIQLASLQALQEIVRATWPRMEAHASFLWGQLQLIAAESDMYKSDTAQNSTEDPENMHDEVRSYLGKIAEMLYWCGGAELQQQLRASLQNGNSDCCRLLHNIHLEPQVATA